MRTHLILALVFFLTITCVWGQDAYFQGRVIDASTREPIAFATIRIKDKAIGVISNEDGSFKIPISFKEMGDVLEVSSMGYQKNFAALAAFRLNDANLVQLMPALFELEETTVRAKIKKLSAYRIVKYAINNIYTNYPLGAHAYLGYYRDYQRRDNTYVNLNEALISVVDQGFKTTDTILTQYAIHEYKENLDFEVDSVTRRPYDYKSFNKVIPGAHVNSRGGNELMLLRVHDPIRNHKVSTFSFVYNLREDFLDNHEFTIAGTTVYDNKPVYKIQIYKDTGKYVVDGFIYIDKANFAIRKFEYAVREMIREKTSETAAYKFNLSSGSTVIVDQDLMLKIVIEYQELAGKMSLNYISFLNKFRVTRPPLFKIENIDIVWSDPSMILHLNKPLRTVRNLKKSTIKVEYDRQNIPIKTLLPVSDTSFMLTFDDKKAKTRLLIKQSISKVIDPDKTKLKVITRRIKDSEGNELEKPRVEELYQFREFFTQTAMDASIYRGQSKKLMKKDVPLFSAQQPRFDLPENQTFWMNTPLKKVQQ